MTTTIATAEAMRTALAAIPGGVFSEEAANLLGSLGYRSDHMPPRQPTSVDDFISDYPTPNPGTQSELTFEDNAESVRILFQFTDAEITSTTQRALLNDEGFSTGNARSFLFVAVELKSDKYARGQYVAFTREINKRWQIPTVVLFRTATNHVTLAFVHRRPNRRDPERDVLGSVSLIREIDPVRPHRAHLEILTELSLSERMLWMDAHGKSHNFDGLLEAWLDALDTEKLNRRFYRDLFDWFQRAVNDVKFPDAVTKNVSREEQVIRLITRLLFVWFIKEKGLVADDLFIENQVGGLLENYDPKSGDSYYRAVLQNLFFATLNTEIGERRFSQQNNDDHRNFSVYRYRDQMVDPDRLIKLFAQTPFINGGLFDCLDSFDATGAGGLRIDCFTDNANHRRGYSIPNRLFFDEDGLITLFNRYKFTVEENTPAEREVALDPELLGKVFENLLAAFNPETRENARKQTGSYYTPRAVVDYMVDEALVATLAQKAAPANADTESWQIRLRDLFDYDLGDAAANFDAEEKDAIVRAIAETKVLDPAVGSGAFPMGVLHKLTLALRRLDPENELWAELQREKARQRAASAFDTDDQAARDVELEEISGTFQRYRDSDFGRKLYLIQNGIYGVDIQPIATQIAKLRFFISLAIDQEPTDDVSDNYGIKPLPNLETRFVAADSLLGLDRPAQMTLGQTHAVKELQDELDRNREWHFHAKTRQQKFGFRGEDKRLREDLAAALQEADFSAGDAEKIAHWDPYDQNASAGWFDAEYMFGIANGFDVVIGNPPYVRADSGESHLEARRAIENSQRFETLWEKWDMYIPFIEHGFKSLKPGGFTTLIVSDAYCHSKYAQKSQDWVLQHGRIIRIDFLSKIKIFDAAVRNVTYLIQRANGGNHIPDRRVHNPEFGEVNHLPADIQDNLTHRVFFPEDTHFEELSVPTLALESICYITKGMVVHAHEKKARGEFTLKDLVSDTASARNPKPFVEGKHLSRWLPATKKWLEWGTERAPNLFSRPTFPQLYEVDEKLISVDMAASTEQLRVAYDDENLYHNHSAWSFVRWHELSGVRNRSIRKQARYKNEMTRVSAGLPAREELEDASRRFGVKYLMGVMNSSSARNFLRANRRSNIHLYPDDWKKLPIPDVDLEEQRPIIEVVDCILAVVSADSNADVAGLEAEIDRLVYELYGLTEEDIVAAEEQQLVRPFQQTASGPGADRH